MYQIVYDFFETNLFDGAVNASWQIGGATLTAAQWLSHTATIIVLAVLAITAFKFVWWLARVVGNAFMMR